MEITVHLAQASSVHQVEVYLGTVDQDGDADFAWADVSSTIWHADPAPPHTFLLFAVHPDGESTVLGSHLTEGAILRDHQGQQDHTLSYRFSVPAADVVGIRLNLRSDGPQDPHDEAFGISVNEVRVFGRPDPLIP